MSKHPSGTRNSQALIVGMNACPLPVLLWTQTLVGGRSLHRWLAGIKEVANVCNQSLMKLVTPEDDEAEEPKPLAADHDESVSKPEMVTSAGESFYNAVGLITLYQRTSLIWAVSPALWVW